MRADQIKCENWEEQNERRINVVKEIQRKEQERAREKQQDKTGQCLSFYLPPFVKISGELW